MKSLKKILSLAISLSFLWQQLGFAQVAAMDLGKYLTPKALMAEKFRPMHMRYFSYDGQNQSFDFLLDKGNIKNVKGPAAKEQANAIFKYFLIGISLPNEAFWVNLRPDSEDQIIDPELAKTDMGKVLLEADLQLKKDTAVFTSPNNAKGREYWNRLYKKAGELFGQEDVTIPTLTRPWIVPGEVIVRYTGTSAYVYKSALKVMLEQDHLKNSVQYNFSDPRLKALNEYSSQLIRELIIPELNKQINTAKKYAELRQVFYSLVLAQCFKLKFSHNGGSYAQRIDSRNLSGLISTNNWSKTTYYKEYQQSFKDGEYNIKEPIRTPFGQTMRSYFSGGFQGAVSPAAFVPGNPANPVAAVAADGSVAMRVEGGQV
ncbi:MAG: hypothetical protein NTY47_00105, partial [Candidatus Omnitrophica bacterium]|nr:hypothetical protein [Candidatus Omnitrophota bacterium]